MGVEYAKHLLSQVRIEIREYVAQLQADLKHAQKMNKELRQRASAEQQEKRYRDMSDAIDRLERENTQLATDADELRTDAERYRKLKPELEYGLIHFSLVHKAGPSLQGRTFDDAVDALPDVAK